MVERWSFWRWLQESRKYMAHRSAWWVYPRAVAKWAAFNQQQKRDMREIAESPRSPGAPCGTES